MEIKKLYTCGCSFMSVDVGGVHPIVSFLDLYAKSKGFKHISLARSGATNFLIRLQIDHAIANRADYVVIGTTSNDRIDLAIGVTGYPVVLEDVAYEHYGSHSQYHVLTNNPTVISDSISNWTEGNYEINVHGNQNRSVNTVTIQAMKHYVAYLHDTNLQTQKDYYVIAEGVRKLINLEIPFVLIPSASMSKCDWSFVGDQLWTGPLPWSMPCGFDPSTVNHNPQPAHDLFVQTLEHMTVNWK